MKPTTGIATMRYDEVAQVLTVVFRDFRGATRFFDVPPADWAVLNAVFSKATYLQQVMEPRYRTQHLMAA